MTRKIETYFKYYGRYGESWEEWLFQLNVPEGFLWNEKFMHEKIQTLSHAIYQEFDKWEWIAKNAKNLNKEIVPVLFSRDFEPLCYFHRPRPMRVEENKVITFCNDCFLQDDETCNGREEIVKTFKECLNKKIKWRKKIKRLAAGYVNRLKMELILGNVDLDRQIDHGFWSWYNV